MIEQLSELLPNNIIEYQHLIVERNEPKTIKFKGLTITYKAIRNSYGRNYEKNLRFASWYTNPNTKAWRQFIEDNDKTGVLPRRMTWYKLYKVGVIAVLKDLGIDKRDLKWLASTCGGCKCPPAYQLRNFVTNYEIFMDINSDLSISELLSLTDEIANGFTNKAGYYSTIVK